MLQNVTMPISGYLVNVAKCLPRNFPGTMHFCQRNEDFLKIR